MASKQPIILQQTVVSTPPGNTPKVWFIIPATALVVLLHVLIQSPATGYAGAILHALGEIWTLRPVKASQTNGLQTQAIGNNSFDYWTTANEHGIKKGS